MGKHAAPEPLAPATGPSSQEKHPWRAVARTAFALLVALATTVPTFLATAGLDHGWAAVQIIAVCGLVTRIMADPRVNAVLRKIAPWLAPEAPA